MTLKEKIAEFVELARSCPEKLQEACFQVLLEDYLSREKTDTSNKKKQTPATDTPPEKLEETTKQQVILRLPTFTLKLNGSWKSRAFRLRI